MTALSTRRRPRPLYDESQLADEQKLGEVLAGQDVRSGWFDDAEESDLAERFEPTGVDFVSEDITVPVIPKKVDEFTCSNCFLIQHMSRLSRSTGGQLICTDCE